MYTVCTRIETYFNFISYDSVPAMDMYGKLCVLSILYCIALLKIDFECQ